MADTCAICTHRAHTEPCNYVTGPGQRCRCGTKLSIVEGLEQARESAQKLPESLRDAVRRSGTASTIRSRGV